jgi:arylsulfatase A-like enzyme
MSRQRALATFAGVRRCRFPCLPERRGNGACGPAHTGRERAATGRARVAAGCIGLASLLVSCGGGDPGPPADERPSVLLVTLDTTRPDHLGCYGYARPTSPKLDELCADAVVYSRAYSTSSWTLPAHASLFTGRFPVSHGARYDPEGSLVLADGIRGEWAKDFRASGLASQLPTLAEVFQKAGYATGAVVAGPWMKSVFGLSRGFDDYEDRRIARFRGRLGQEVTDTALAWLGDRADTPFFLFLNYYDPHAPYQPPPELLAQFFDLDSLARGEETPSPEEVTARYDGEIRYMDAQLGRLLDALKAWGIYTRMWIVVTADHGELFGEHGLEGHGASLYEGEIRIPMIVKPPGPLGAGERSDEPIQLTDVAPLLLEGAGVPEPPGMSAPLPEADRGALFAELHPLRRERREGGWHAILAEGYKLLLADGTPSGLFDVEADPDETRNLLGQEPERAARLTGRLNGWLEALPRPERPAGEKAVDEETRRALESLGYLESP